MQEKIATFDSLPNELRADIAGYLDTKSLCFFAATSRRSLGNAVKALIKHRDQLQRRLRIYSGMNSSFYQTPRSLYACGENYYGQLGLGHNEPRRQWTRIENLPGIVRQVVTGVYHTFLLTDQGLYACGNNGYGQLGLGHNRDCYEWTRVENLPGTVQQVVTGSYHTFALTDQGLYGCGSSSNGELGLEYNKPRYQWTKIEAPPGTIQQIAVGGYITGGYYSFILTDQGLYACGHNEYHQLGLGHNKPCYQWTRIENLPGTVQQVLTGGFHTFVLIDQGLYACGNNARGQLGLGHTLSCKQWAKVALPPGIIQQVVAGSFHTFALTDQGLYACGGNWTSQAGLMKHKHDYPQWTQIEYLSGTILQIATYVGHTLVLTDHGLYACGYNRGGQLGLEDKDEYCSFTLIESLSADIKYWLSYLRHLNNLITLSGYTDNPREHSDISHMAKRVKTL